MPIGEVTDMLLRYRVQIDDPTLARLPVFIGLDEKRLVKLGTTRAVGLRREGLEDLIRLGLRARLETQSLVTGVLYVGLDLLPDTPVVRVLPPEGPDLEIPTIPTTSRRSAATSSPRCPVVRTRTC